MKLSRLNIDHGQSKFLKSTSNQTNSPNQSWVPRDLDKISNKVINYPSNLMKPSKKSYLINQNIEFDQTFHFQTFKSTISSLKCTRSYQETHHPYMQVINNVNEHPYLLILSHLSKSTLNFQAQSYCSSSAIYPVSMV